MKTLPLLLALGLLTAGCIGKAPAETGSPAATVDEPIEEASVEPTPATTAPPAKPSQQSSTSNGTASGSAPPATPPPAAPEPAAAPRIEVLAWNGTFTGAGVGAGTPAGEVCCLTYAADAPSSDVTFAVPAGLKGIVVELAWSDAGFDLDLAATAPDYDGAPAPPEPYTGHRYLAVGGAPGQPDAHARIVLVDEEALALVGDWHALVSAKGPANAVVFTLAVSLFYDAPPADDHSAIATPSGNP